MDAHKHRLLVLGSGPSAAMIDQIDRKGYYVIALNNGWRAMKNPYEIKLWHHSNDIHHYHPLPERDLMDHLYVTGWGYITHFFQTRATCIYDREKFPTGTTAFLDLMSRLSSSRPNMIGEIAFLGCEHDYSGEQTHFYGKGTPDPMRYGSYFLIENFRRIRQWADREGIVLRDFSGNTTGLLYKAIFDESSAGNPPVEGASKAV